MPGGATAGVGDPQMMKDPNNILDRGANAGNSPSTATSLLVGIKANDPEAWRRLARLYAPLVYHWACRQGLQPRDAEDIIQEVFLTVAKRVDTFRREREGDTFRGWLWTITRHKLGDWLRRQKRREHEFDGTEAERLLLEVPDPGTTEAVDVEDPVGVRQLCRRALEMIRAEFEEQSWQAFWRVAVEGKSAAEVAEELHVSRNAVYVAKSRILCRLQQVLGDA